MDDLKEALKSINQLTSQIKFLEDHVISSLSDSNVKLDVVLKELVAYLNITAQNLKDVNTNIIELTAYKDIIKPIPAKIDNVENRIFEITKTLIDETNKTRQNLSKMSKYISNIFLKILSNDKDQSIEVRGFVCTAIINGYTIPTH